MPMIERNCVACGQVGTDPRHITVLGDGVSEAAHHHDCGTRLSPPCAVCVAVLANAGVAGETGEDMRELLVAAPAVDLNTPAEG